MEKITLKIGGNTKKNELIQPKKGFKVEEESDNEENDIKKTNKDIIKASLYKQTYTSDVYEALAEDPTIFSYDLYKSKPIKEESQVNSTNKEPIYHENLKRNAEFKKKEREIIKERVEHQQREKEKEEFGETEIYYTQSYLKLLKENKDFEQKLDQHDLISELHSIEHKNPEKFLNSLISDPNSEPSKKPKLEESENITSILPATEITQMIIINKRSESELKCAKERYLQRKRGK